MQKYLLLLLLFVVCPPVDITEAQDDQAGYISIDCGLQGSNYTDQFSELYYTSDVGFVDNGVGQSVATIYQSDNYLEKQFKTLRYFSEGLRNCYTLRPSQGKGGKYLIRARFMYGNYDGLNQPPNFDLHIGNRYWETIKITNASTLHKKEIIHNPLSDHIHICLVKTGPSIPFISTLELRPLNSQMYPTKERNISLSTVVRVNINPAYDGEVRFKDDIYDRIWSPFLLSDSRTINSSFLADNQYTVVKVPSIVMSTAAEALNSSDHLLFYWVANATFRYYIFLHFEELQVLKANQIRSMDIIVNDILFSGNYSPPYLQATLAYSASPKTGNTTYIVDIAPSPGTTLPPIINAAEVFSVVDFPFQETFDGDVAALVSIKSTYNLTENWQGDPCGPDGFQWNGINCTNIDRLNKPKIISLNLSSKRLFGSIAPAIFQLKALTTLDLSNNLLTGVLPDFLAELDLLTVLNLKGNNFSGSCPGGLIDKANTGKLNLISDNLCGGTSSVEQKKKKKSSLLLPIVAVAAGVFLVVICASSLAFYIVKQRKQRGTFAKVDTEVDNVAAKIRMSSSSPNEDPKFVFLNKNRQFTYHEVLHITNNFKIVIGKGGFGTVYHGYVDDVQVAVKMLSPSSSQGYKEFQAEASLLMTIHHKNLTSLVGYCYEGINMAIIYEYMPNGNMEKHLLGNETHVLTWEERLRMAIDAAQGLEYLHHGCKPPIVHRDIKITNILLDEKFRAKLADFGLSRAFSVEDATHVSTDVAGTPGYLDPEYYSTTRLTEKNDIYSFGIVLLEVVTGRPALQRNNDMPHIITWVCSELEKGDIDNIVDPKLRGEYSINSIWKVLEVAMSCIARNALRRPTMNFVVIELTECLTMETRSDETESKDSIKSISLNKESGFIDPQAR